MIICEHYGPYDMDNGQVDYNVLNLTLNRSASKSLPATGCPDGVWVFEHIPIDMVEASEF